ncbi:MAG: undecaprenyl/decaprenyl-phosphate alpha-N-acetylglucosaminyl 1-phosphate transferase [Alphaproteobacteria bacterium]|nr:undecaprenyl/decaprenyl-phosphate alpha-N-acetylglucosaminyl 1-phosphate transferase [Alphaproteobacteria bacterium]
MDNLPFTQLLFVIFGSLIFLYILSNLLKVIDFQDPIIPGRSLHKQQAYLGGGFFFIACLLFSLLIVSYSTLEILMICAASALGILGIIDDRITVAIRWKFILQFVIVISFLFWSGLSFSYLELGFTTIPLGPFGLIISSAAVMLVINALNYFDGIDGLCLGLVLTKILLLFNYFFIGNFSSLLLILAILCVIFLFANFRLIGLNKLFLGDGGNYILSFIISLAVINSLSHSMALEQKHVHLNGLWFFGLLFFEFIAVSWTRRQEKRSIFEPGQDHLHHLLLTRWNNPVGVTFVICILSAFIFVIGYKVTAILPQWSLVIFILTQIGYVFARSLLKINSRPHGLRNSTNEK